mgnify:CR=1 FL=1
MSAATLGLEIGAQGLFNGSGGGNAGKSAIGIETIPQGAEVSPNISATMPLMGSVNPTSFNKGNSFTQPSWITANNNNILSGISAIGVIGIWVAIPIGWFLADAAGIIYYIFKAGKSHI